MLSVKNATVFATALWLITILTACLLASTSIAQTANPSVDTSSDTSVAGNPGDLAGTSVTEDAENTGNAEKSDNTSDSGDTLDTGNTSDSGNTPDTGNPSDSNDSNDSNDPDSTVTSGNTDETATPADSGSIDNSNTPGGTNTSSNTGNTGNTGKPDTQAARTDLADAISDLLIVLDSDGRSHTVQHTVASQGASLRLHIPGSVVPQEILFFGFNQQQSRLQNKDNANLIELNNGQAFARYQHQYGDEVEQIEPGHFVLTTPSIPPNVELTGAPLNHSAITWVFPNEYELISYTITDPDTGRWVAIDNTLTFHQLSKKAVELSINYKRNVTESASNESPCNQAIAPNDACSKDDDEDGVPDYRDICVSPLGQDNNQYGCARDKSMLLDAVDFAIGRTYLDVGARQALDRVAYAMLKHEGRYFEIGAHTDNEGAAKSNQQLSKKRADAVRHYLILRGVDPNVVRAAGYGEKYPIRDNASSEGRRANRRIELMVIN